MRDGMEKRRNYQWGAQEMKVWEMESERYGAQGVHQNEVASLVCSAVHVQIN